MEAIQQFTGKVAGLNRLNVDTDQIIPKQFLKRIERSGFGQFLFYDWRFHDDGTPNETFELNRPENEGASILVTNENFGCGSSREHAPWSLLDYGFRVIIAPSFADIFYNNCMQNGMVPIRARREVVERLFVLSEASDFQLHIDLVEKRYYTGDGTINETFDIDEYRRQMLLKGWDDIDVTLSYADAITAYENHFLK